MSYARFSKDSDIYVYAHVGGGFECCACRIGPLVKSISTEGCTNHCLFGDVEPCDKCNGEGCNECMMPDSVRLSTRSEMITHLKEHIKAGHRVPGYTIDILKKEIKEEGEANEPMFNDGYDGPAVVDVRTGKVQKFTDLLEEKDK